MGNYWKNHGTKILGTVTTLLGAISAASPDTLSGLFGPRAPAIAVAAAGLLTIIRGFTNSANNNTSGAAK
jgi:hypothetical protein